MGVNVFCMILNTAFCRRGPQLKQKVYSEKKQIKTISFFPSLFIFLTCAFPQFQ